VELAWKLLDGDVAGAWDSLLAAASSATFFQTRAWAELLSRTFPGWRSDPILIEFSDGNRMVLPMMRHRRTGYRECTLPHVYGGPVFLHPPTAAHLEAAAAAPRWFPDITVIDNPFAPYRRDQQGLARWRLETTATDLAPGFDALWKRFRETHRRHYKSALKQGVTIALAGSLDDVDAYFSIYADSLRRWGDGAIGFYPRRLFRNMLTMPEFGQEIPRTVSGFKRSLCRNVGCVGADTWSTLGGSRTLGRLFQPRLSASSRIEPGSTTVRVRGWRCRRTVRRRDRVVARSPSRG
jgi:hypothetical protein